MWDLGSFWGEGKSTPVSSYLAVMQEIHVLLVDHDPECLMSTSKLLEMYQYKVTVFELASAAITMLSNGKVKVDLIMANINSPDLHGFKLVQLAVTMDIPIILMSVDDNAFMSTRAIENGAFLYIKKPAAVEMVKCLWQHVARERMRAMRERERLMAANYRGINELINPSNDHSPNHVFTMKDYGKAKKSYYKSDEGYDSDVVSQGKVKRKVCTEWTQELHEKFLDAVEQLGEGRCFPKEILELMNVPGLTRMQVASHLQKCRNDNWRSPEERKAANNGNPQSSDTEGSQSKPRRFGSMPRLGRALSFGGEGSKAQPEPEMGNENMGNEGVPIMAIATTYQYQQQYVVPHASNVVPGINSSNQSADDYFCYQEMDSLIQNFSGGSAGMAHPHSGPGGYHFEPVYAGHDQNLKGPNMDNRSQWTSSETSNFGSDESAETRGP